MDAACMVGEQRWAITYFYIQQERFLGLFHNPLLSGCIHRQSVHPSTIELLELADVGDSRKDEESQAFSSLGQMERLLCNLPQNLTPREISQVAGVSMSHQQLRFILAYMMEPFHILLCCLVTLDLLSPCGAVEILQVFLQSSSAIQFSWEINRCVDWIVLIPLTFLLQS